MYKKLLTLLLGGMLIFAFASPALAGECEDLCYGLVGTDYTDCFDTCEADTTTAGTTDPDDINTYFRAGGTGTAETFADDAALGGADLSTTIAGIINVALGFLGIVAVVIILAGGFKWMTAAGNEEKVKEARKLLVGGLIGLIIVLAAYAIADFAIKSIITATN
ncbi:MAG: MMCAP2_0565 family pilin-like conjugal transfer protein [Patescibacteria group bacterium]